MTLLADVRAMVQGFPESVSFLVGGTRVSALFNARQQDVDDGIGGRIKRSDLTLTMAAPDAALLVYGTVITLAGTRYTVRQTLDDDDALVTHVVIVAT